MWGFGINGQRHRLGLGGFVAMIAAHQPRRLAAAIAIQAVSALLQAVAVLLLIPLLGAVGVGASKHISHWTRHLFLAVGVRPTLATVLVVYVAITGLSASVSACANVLATRYRLDFINHLRARLYGAVARAQWRHLMGIRRADLLAVLTANVNLVAGGVIGALGVIVSLIVITAQLVAAVQISPPMTGLAVASGIVLVLVVWPLVRRSRQLGADLVRLNRAAVRHANAFLDALKLAKAYGREGEHEAAYMDAAERARDAQVSFAIANSIANSVQATLTATFRRTTIAAARG